MKGLTQLASQRLDDGLQLCSEIRHGNWPGILKETIIAEQVDLVVIPKGRRRISDALLNRINISRLVQQSGCTALMVTRSFNAHHMENIVVPVHGILPVKKLVAATYVSMESNGHIYLMGNENRLRGQDQDSLFKAYHLLSEYSRCRVHCALKESDDVAGNTLAFAKDVKANLIVVEANGEAGLKGWWNRMWGRQLYGESDIPVLTVAH